MTELSEQLGQALGGAYVIERELGGGGMSRVFLAEETALGRRVVIKVLPPELSSALSVERFQREMRIVARFQHPHIVPVLTTGTAAGLLYYTMPYVAGESLRHRVDREGPLPLEEAVRIAREAASALAYAHGQGVVHRDVKPENILLSEGHAVVADFGIARVIDAAAGGRLTVTGLSPGTPTYMSPEQGSGDVRLDGRSDQYSLGCVVYEMLAGVPPFHGPTAMAIVAQHMADDPRPLRRFRPGVPPEVERCVLRALAKLPVDRFADLAEFSAALERGLRSSYFTPGAETEQMVIPADAGLTGGQAVSSPPAGAARGHDRAHPGLLRELARSRRLVWLGCGPLTLAVALGGLLVTTRPWTSADIDPATTATRPAPLDSLPAGAAEPVPGPAPVDSAPRRVSFRAVLLYTKTQAVVEKYTKRADTLVRAADFEGAREELGIAYAAVEAFRDSLAGPDYTRQDRAAARRWVVDLHDKLSSTSESLYLSCAMAATAARREGRSPPKCGS